MNSYVADKKKEVEYIVQILNDFKWNKTHAAKELGMTYRGLHKKMKRLRIERVEG